MKQHATGIKKQHTYRPREHNRESRINQYVSSTRVPKIFSGKRIVSLTIGDGKLISTCRRMKLDPFQHQKKKKKDSKWIKDINVRPGNCKAPKIKQRRKAS